MIASGDRIVAGVSGGADSLCLLFLLLKYARRVPFRLCVVHVDHGIRRDAKEDARYVEELCAGEGIPFILRKADVPAFAKAEKCSDEDAGRRIRYEAFREAAEGMGGAKIAVAHNSNDNAETMLFHLFRGSGLKGLCGIAPVREGVIRPILCLDRREAEAYLEERGIVWRTDSTNDGDDYSRNRIRHHILPYAESKLFPGAVERMLRTAEMLQETEAYLEQQTREALETCRTKTPWREGFFRREPGEETLEVEAFLRLHPALRRRVLHMLLKGLSPTGKDIGQVHVGDALGLFLQQGNRTVDLPFGIIVRRQYGRVVLERRRDSAEKGAERDAGARMKDHGAWEAGPVRLPEENSGDFSVYDLGNLGKIEFTAFSAEKSGEVPKNQYTKWFDYDKIEESPVLRIRQKGDYMTIADGRGGMRHKSLQDYMVTEKIPRQLRNMMPLLASGNHVIWLIGRRISEAFKVDGNTKRILQARLLGEGDRDCRGSETEEKNV